MKRFLSQASKGAGCPSKVKGGGQAVAVHGSPSAELNSTTVRTQASSGLVEKLESRVWTYLDSRGSKVLYWPRLLSSNSKRVLASLLAEVPWEQRDVVVFGKSVPQPRLICYMADGQHLQYTYSGLTVTPQPWSAAVQEVKEAVEQLCGCTFNSCLLNQYRTGQDSLSWHSDNEFRVYGREPVIATVSFGETRDFLLRNIAQRNHKVTVNLAAGDALVMAGAVQQHWQHCVPQRKAVLGARVSLTFRTILRAELQLPSGSNANSVSSKAQSHGTFV